MKKYLCYIGIILAVYACDKNEFHDTGLAYGKHDCSMWEYFAKDHADWDSVVMMIERAGLVNIFDGTHPQYKEITFFGITNLSVNQFLVKNLDENKAMKYQGVRDIPDYSREKDAARIRLRSKRYFNRGNNRKDAFWYRFTGLPDKESFYGSARYRRRRFGDSCFEKRVSG